jgi:hypothetical protein
LDGSILHIKRPGKVGTGSFFIRYASPSYRAIHDLDVRENDFTFKHSRWKQKNMKRYITLLNQMVAEAKQVGYKNDKHGCDYRYVVCKQRKRSEKFVVKIK